MIVNKKCLECGKEFEYDEKPGFPRKYCFACGAEKKKSFAAKQEDKVEVVKPGEPIKSPTYMKTSEKGLYEPTSMYVSYAKDIFCTMLSNIDAGSVYNGEQIMKDSIELVKQARDSF